LRSQPCAGWACPYCLAEEDGPPDKSSKSKRGGQTKIKKRIAAVRKCHKQLKDRSRSFLFKEKSNLKPLVNPTWFNSFMVDGDAPAVLPFQIGKSPPFVHAVLRSYQVKGVNWLLSRYAFGTGCIMADEMGLGKTIQTLSFIAALQHEGVPGPHLVVTPLAVLQNWANEINRFTPDLTHVKIHGSMKERDRLLSRNDVTEGEFDIYLTTYDTFLSEEAFFTESFLFNTVTIDEGHRLKNISCKLCKGLARLNSPFRVLLTGTPLQNCLAELIALLQYILPSVSLHEHLLLPPTTVQGETKSLDRLLISQARDLLEACMIRRIKSEVEASLLPKIEYVLKPPLTRLQRKWYRSFLESNGIVAMGLLTKFQLMCKVLQLGKVANHPKTFALTYDRERKKNADMAKRAHGSMFVKLDTGDVPQTPEAIASEAELRGLVGEKLVNSSGKLALLDRLMLAKRKCGSRVLVFTQFTLTLDVLEEYVKHRFGSIGVAYLRLDGNTGRIQREMDMRSFNKPGCGIFCYLISTRAGGQGINLASADTVVLYDTCWNPQVDLQAQDRAHRIGQKKQVVIYRLIAENTVEERVFARARQKMVLDALVIKKRVGGNGPADALIDDGEEEGEEEMAKLSVDELWNMLSQGASKVFDPAVDKAEDYDAKDYDRLISEAKPSKWDDKTDGGSSGDKPSVEGCNQSELDGSIFAPVKQERVSKSEVEVINISSSDDESFLGVPVIAESSCFVETPKKEFDGFAAKYALYTPTIEVLLLPLVDFWAEFRSLKVTMKNSISYEKMKSLVSCQFWDSFVQKQAGNVEMCLGLKDSFDMLQITLLQMEKDMISSFADEQCLIFNEDKEMDNEKTVLWRGILIVLASIFLNIVKYDMYNRFSESRNIVQFIDDMESTFLMSDGRRRGKRARTPPKKFIANAWDNSTRKKRIKMHRDLNCFVCRQKVVKTAQVPPKIEQRSCKANTTPLDSNAPLECIACPRVYHIDCSGENKRPKTRSWYCPWHSCVTCKRKSSETGGVLFHCVSCPLTYCFDCSPDEHTEGGQSTSSVSLSLTASLERRGVASLKSYLFFTCGDCKTRRSDIFV